MQTWSGRTIDVPSCFISGKQDWGIYQRPGVFEAMQKKACTNMIGCHLVDGAGHWVQQEQPAEVSRLLLEFLKQAGAAEQQQFCQADDSQSPGYPGSTFRTMMHGLGLAASAN